MAINETCYTRLQKSCCIEVIVKKTLLVWQEKCFKIWKTLLFILIFKSIAKITCITFWDNVKASSVFKIVHWSFVSFRHFASYFSDKLSLSKWSSLIFCVHMLSIHQSMLSFATWFQHAWWITFNLGCPAFTLNENRAWLIVSWVLRFRVCLTLIWAPSLYSTKLY